MKLWSQNTCNMEILVLVHFIERAINLAFYFQFIAVATSICEYLQTILSCFSIFFAR